MTIDTPQLFKVLSDLTRLRCLSLLYGAGELCVCELTHVLELPQPKISHHLGALRKIGLVADRKEGLWVYYQINPKLPQWVLQVIQTTMEGIKAQQPYINDRKALKGMSSDPAGLCVD